MKLIEFRDMNRGKVFINPMHVVRVYSSGLSVCVSLSDGQLVQLDGQGIDSEKAVWYVIETLRTGKHPYDEKE
tara:strand:- start:525 stop:743 length:219 start_codon:yes stop_codon:yes gene_type:complete